MWLCEQAVVESGISAMLEGRWGAGIKPMASWCGASYFYQLDWNQNPAQWVMVCNDTDEDVCTRSWRTCESFLSKPPYKTRVQVRCLWLPSENMESAWNPKPDKNASGKKTPHTSRGTLSLHLFMSYSCKKKKTTDRPSSETAGKKNFPSSLLLFSFHFSWAANHALSTKAISAPCEHCHLPTIL